MRGPANAKIMMRSGTYVLQGPLVRAHLFTTEMVYTEYRGL